MCAGARSIAARTSASAPSRVLPGQRVHQVEIEVVKARGVQLLRGGARLVRRVDAAQARKQRRLEALRPERDARDARRAVVGEASALDRARVGLERDLGGRVDGEAPLEAREQLADGGRFEEARRAAAQEQAPHRAEPAASQRTRLRTAAALGVDVGQERLEVFPLRQFTLERVRVEVAVRAFAHAPGEMQVQRERRRL